MLISACNSLDEINSYMYQTVGQDAIEFVAKALDVPLYRRVISGDAVHQGNEYGARSAQEAADLKGDETEDLYELLRTVLVSEIPTFKHLLLMLEKGTPPRSPRSLRRSHPFQLPTRPRRACVGINYPLPLP